MKRRELKEEETGATLSTRRGRRRLSSVFERKSREAVVKVVAKGPKLSVTCRQQRDD